MVERAEPIHFAATLRDKVTPRRGGLQISSGAGICTLGFNTLRVSGLILVRSFITASHCTNVRGGVEGTQFHQPAPSNLIGTEAADPAFFTGFPCPVARRCRFSDAARVRYATGVSSDLGGIARTTSRSVADGPITINAANPFFNITAELSPVQGVQVNKVGRTTGWTYAESAAPAWPQTSRAPTSRCSVRAGRALELFRESRVVETAARRCSTGAVAAMSL